MAKLMMTTSGTRGVVGENLTPLLTTKIAMAFGTYALVERPNVIHSSPVQDQAQGATPSQNSQTAPPIIVGGDTRTSHDMFKRSVIAGLQAVGIDVIDIGQVPTPTVQQMIRHYNAAGGVVVTASHNPIIWNGIKLMNHTGSFLNDDEHAVFMRIFNEESFNNKDWNGIGTYTEDPSAIEKHVQTICQHLNVSALKHSGLKVCVDVNHGTGAVADPILFKALGVEATLMYSEPDGRFEHEPEPMEKNLNGLMKEMATGQYDIGFAQDPDADRLVIVDNNGHFIGEDVSLAFCIDYILEKEQQLAGSQTFSPDVVVNLSTSSIIEWVGDKYGANTHYSRIGETNVTQKIKDLKALVGGEGNGGVMYPKIGWGRDSLTGIVTALLRLQESGKTVEELVADYPKFHLLREKFTCSSRDEINAYLEKMKSGFNGEKLDDADGVKVYLQKGWIHVRPSNTEPIIRVFIETRSETDSAELYEQAKQVLGI